MISLPNMKKKELVSIIVTTKNEEDVISNLLKSIQNQTYKYIETILVDNNSYDKTLAIANKFKGIKIFSKGPERSAQRNYGAKKSHGRFLLFVDADMELSTNVVKECIEKVEENQNIAAMNIPEVSIGISFWEKVKAYERSFYNEEGDELTDAARFFKKDVFVSVGGYDEAITGPEDWDLPETIKERGGYITRIASPIYHHERISSLWLLVKKKYYYGLKAHSYLKRHKVSIIGPKTIYFLRPIFYKQWKKLISHPFLTISLFCMFFIELFAGGAGFIIGRLNPK